ncbi:MAG: prephenate dehydrogenase [Eubacteriales bacterium]|jgi:prephenate dehydrogenase|nr:prephenate dehydrogenase [Eubacteriales bacterium]
MTIGIAGLGLIGGSFAKAYKNAGHTVYGFDTDENTLNFAMIAGAVDRVLNPDTIGLCECIVIAVYSGATVPYLESVAAYVSPHTTVIDCCGTKSAICADCFKIAEQYGFSFFGGHPMAGTQYSGFKHSSASLFAGASMIIVPPRFDDIALINNIKLLLEPLRLGKITVTTAEKHDEIIAFTSQLAHIISNAYVKSPTAQIHAGYSAGSYKDLSRVARLNEEMWTDLFMDNRDNLLSELDIFINSLNEYRSALAQHNSPAMKELLSEGTRCKKAADGQ